MGWIRNGVCDHEGWVANVLADGRVSSSTTGRGVIVHELKAADVAARREVRHYENADHFDVVVPWEEVVIWRSVCECGWTGLEQPAATDPDYGTRDCPEELKERVFRPAWDAHVAPFTALGDLEELAERVRGIEDRMIEVVRLARVGGHRGPRSGGQPQ